MSKAYTSEALAAVHEMMEGLRETGTLDKRTFRGFDEACLAPTELLHPEEIKATRKQRLKS